MRNIKSTISISYERLVTIWEAAFSFFLSLSFFFFFFLFCLGREGKGREGNEWAATRTAEDPQREVGVPGRLGAGGFGGALAVGFGEGAVVHAGVGGEAAGEGEVAAVAGAVADEFGGGGWWGCGVGGGGWWWWWEGGGACGEGWG